MNTWRIVVGDALERLRELDAGSVQTCVTSPPYFGLRDYSSDGQLGLEATPDEYVARLVEVFREVRRVLRDDGTLWLNLGDSYASSSTYNTTNSLHNEHGWKQDGDHRPNAYAIPGVKPKDLLGIPWSVAFALRQPYYDGNIKREQDRIWLAAMIDTEGSIGVNWQRAGEHRARDSYSLSIKVSNTSIALVERCAQIAGCGSALLHDRRGRDCFAWSVYGDEARRVLREVYPYLVAKQQEARLAYGSLGRPAYEALRLLHAGTETTTDAPAPPECWTPGWYLRSDIIWAKPNPMPESVTDRPTKAHEYVFLLSKGPRYFYDADAVREPVDMEYLEKRWGGNNDRGRNAGLSNDASHVDGSSTHVGVNPAGRNKRSVWTVATQPFPGAHFAVFPPKLIEPCVLAGSAEDACGVCGAPWERVVEREGPTLPDLRPKDIRTHLGASDKSTLGQSRTGVFRPDGTPRTGVNHTAGWQPSCAHQDKTGTSTVLDPFAGAGTTGLVATRLGRSFIGIELNPEYAEMARERIRDDAPLMNYLIEAAS